MKSIIQKEKECYLCGATKGLENHHCVHGSGWRKLADSYGLTVWLCYKHHRDNKAGVHGMNTEADKMLKRTAQKAFEKKWNHELWMLQFGRNYLGEENEDGSITETEKRY